MTYLVLNIPDNFFFTMFYDVTHISFELVKSKLQFAIDIAFFIK